MDEIVDYEQAEGLLRSLVSAVAKTDGNGTADGDRARMAHRDTESGELPPSELRHADLRYRALVEHIPAVTFMASLDAGTSELYVRPQIEFLLGFTQDEWLGDPFLWYRQLHPDDRQHWQEEFAKTCFTGVNFRSDYRFLAKDGRTVWVRGEASIIRDDNGNPLFLQGIAFDITEIKHAEEQLRNINETLEREVAVRTADLQQTNTILEQQVRYRELAEQRFRRTVESAPIAMVMIDDHGKIILVNDETERLFGYERGELLDKQIEILVPERFRSKHPSHRNEFFEDPSSRRMGGGRDLFARRKDGSEFPVEIGLNPMETEEGLFVLSAVVDITERRHAQEALTRYAVELERSNKNLDEFAYVASHDLRSPMQGIRKLAGWIHDDNAETLPEKSILHLEQMRTRIGRLETLLDDLLEYSRAGRMHGELADVDTAEMTRRVVSLFQTPDEFSVKITGEFPTIHTHRSPLEQVLRNLLNNAIKHHDRIDGCVEISCRNIGDCIELAVIDDGPGIAEEYQEQIFKMFETLTSRDEVEGSGMGLAIVKKIVENYGGKLLLKSATGAGATFYFTWPKNLPK